MTLLLIAFLSGVLTVLAPCVLPMLPIVMGASAEDVANKKIPLIIIASLSVSIILFSILLKASLILIDVPPTFWKAFSGGIILALGIITIFPNLWTKISEMFGFSGKSNHLLESSSRKSGLMKYVLMGFALGPVFSSCSPTYAMILAIILPAGFMFGFFALISYTLGLASILFVIALFGQKVIQKISWASKPNGWFKKILGVIFVIVGVSILTGFDKKIETAALESGFLNTTIFEQNIIDSLELDTQDSDTQTQKEVNYTSMTAGTCTSGSCGKKINGSLDFLNPESILKDKKSYKAPDLVGLDNWINSDPIQSLDELQGKVVMIDFWTLGCINCINTHDETNKLYEEFKNQGLEIIGLHAPEFAYERKIENVKNAVEEFGIKFPVATDNDFATWKRYNNRYWPAFYIIDGSGQVRYTHFGEGGYEEKREVIQELISKL